MAKSKRSLKQPSLMSYARPAFGMGLGLFGSLIVYMLIAVIFFISGFVLLKQEQKKPKDKQNTSLIILAYVLMVIGCAVGLGFGAGELLGELGG